MGHVAAVRCVQYDGHKVVSGAYDYTVKVWDPESESCTHTLQGHTNRVYSLQVGPWLPLRSRPCATGTRAMPVSASPKLSPHPMQGHTGHVRSLQVRHSLPLHPDPHTRMRCRNTHSPCLFPGGKMLQNTRAPWSAKGCVSTSINLPCPRLQRALLPFLGRPC